ncbi:ATP-binding cassette domain-containing protein [Ktedonosporobacter rubrisoli]|uniref:ATP-binding cassette domain-containing protein n=1 Tax=Ktedonosporobacter rubrisoli TaxID=2509675 RepID=A0A4P6JMB8_KTERU|nr:ATP-binding cassette domain-containing protein [Ktedonosporobacter rubrisoli]QBD76384.1 ATP-binding cassette domain-containing protein [Ktedonosporobacter rubrisoli]
MHTQQPILEVRDLEKYFRLHVLDGRKIEPFHGISFEVQRGKLFLVSGRSGVGKTTILKCIYRTYLSTGGSIWYDSQLFGRINMVEAQEDQVVRLREHELGYCSQFLKVLPRVSALDVTAEPLLKHGMKRQDAQDEAARWLRRLGIEESRWQASPLTFSGGEQQRVNLARAFIAAPRLLLLDEPTASLDAGSKSIVLEIIKEAKDSGVTIVTVTHDTAALLALVDDSYILEREDAA